MKYLTVALLGLAAVASAQSSTAAPPAPSPSLTPEQECAVDCSLTDICCQAACYRVPCPNEDQANMTTKCAADCPQGNGSPEATEEFSRCVQGCISQHFNPTGGHLGPTATDGSGPSPTGTDGEGEDGEGEDEPSGTGEPTATGTGNAASGQLGASTAGILGLMLAAFAL